MPVNTNLAFREFGIALFFAAVGLGAGAKFFATVPSVTGLHYARRRVRYRAPYHGGRHLRPRRLEDEFHGP